MKKIKDALGEVEIKGVPQRVIALDWVYIEDVLASGVQPVGAADIEGYNTWVKVKVDLSPDVQDVGKRFEPNLEQIASLKPDLIIGVKYRHEKIVDQLRAIAPTLIFDPFSEEAAKDPYTEMEETFLKIADVLGKKDEGQQMLDNLNGTYADAKEKLKDNKAGASYVLSQAFSEQNAVTFRLFADNSIAVQIMSKLGMTNAYKSDKLEEFGFSETSVETLTKVQEASLITMIQTDDDSINNFMKDNPVWKNLAFVKENRIFALGGDTWPFGGPLSAEMFTERVVSVLGQ
ncbi:iron complex transport system substrate-binding protein [Paenibacillus forsythiae]|uniref:Iron complex transport system substrate-binding protein n=1 Tax=Paenibacillus forsythiae TaxID=365616 RepID=A0ABU3H2C0_9BACL|nr:iron-siderophore ABC transporter substrate-binding protein [Paenibacillus forsythiae]MDT3424961.1 iron complex transport system substrate-binding protein [Paenibacillus forsythiae]